jgi:oligopeptide transport system substrate-binding protein
MVSWAFNDGLRAKKNQQYWDKDEVRLDEVELVFVDDNTALNMFKADELDWAGSPSGNIPSDAVKGLEHENVLNQRPAAATSWFRINTTRPLLNNKHFRQALYYSIDRKAIAHHLLQNKQLPAASIVPTFWLDSPISVGDSFNPGKAWELFQTALEETDTDRDTMKPLVICYRAGERAQKVAQAVQQQWESTLGIKINLEQCEGIAIFDKWTHMDYDMAFGSWVADIEDPVNFLLVFDSKNTPTNHTGWENKEYQALIERSYTETGDLRLATLSEAQALIIEDAPVIPVFHHTFLYAKQPNVHGIWLSKIGVLDFKHTFIDDANSDELEPLD